MKAVVDKPFGNVVNANSRACTDGPDINDAFMCDQSVGTAVKNREVVIEFVGNVVCAQNCHLGCFE